MQFSEKYSTLALLFNLIYPLLASIIRTVSFDLIRGKRIMHFINIKFIHLEFRTHLVKNSQETNEYSAQTGSRIMYRQERVP
jgi:hypothetical protein